MTIKDKIIYVANNYGVHPLDSVSRITGYNKRTLAVLATRLRKAGVTVGKYRRGRNNSEFKEAVEELLSK